MKEEQERLKELCEEEEDVEVIEIKDELPDSTESMKTITSMHIEVIEWVILSCSFETMFLIWSFLGFWAN